MFTENQLVNIMCAFVGFDAFQVAHVPKTLSLVEDADRAEDVPCSAGDVERGAADFTPDGGFLAGQAGVGAEPRMNF